MKTEVIVTLTRANSPYILLSKVLKISGSDLHGKKGTLIQLTCDKSIFKDIQLLKIDLQRGLKVATTSASLEELNLPCSIDEFIENTTAEGWIQIIDTVTSSEVEKQKTKTSILSKIIKTLFLWKIES